MAELSHSTSQAGPFGRNCPKCERGTRFGHCLGCGRCQNAAPMGLCWNCMKAMGPRVAAELTLLYVERVIPDQQYGPWPGFGPELLAPEAKRRYEAARLRLEPAVGQAAD